MSSKRELAKLLRDVSDFQQPSQTLEQYCTPPDIAATLVHTAALQGDTANRLVVDFGCGTGMLALASAFRGPDAVVGIDIDPNALDTARENERLLGVETPVSWVRGNITHRPLCPPGNGDVTVLMNPPFGAQSGNVHADRPFLHAAADIADVSYSIHNAGSLAFVESFVDDRGGEVTHAYEAELSLPRAFEFHTEESKSIAVESFRIEWGSE